MGFYTAVITSCNLIPFVLVVCEKLYFSWWHRRSQMVSTNYTKPVWVTAWFKPHATSFFNHTEEQLCSSSVSNGFIYSGFNNFTWRDPWSTQGLCCADESRHVISPSNIIISRCNSEMAAQNVDEMMGCCAQGYVYTLFNILWCMTLYMNSDINSLSSIKPRRNITNL